MNQFLSHGKVLAVFCLAVISAIVFAFMQPLGAETSAVRGISVVAKTAGGQTQTVPLYGYTAALIIGIDRYANLSASQQLKFAVKDAKGVEKVLRDSYKFDEITTLFNEQATRDNILEALLKYRAMSPDAGVFVYYAGHGITLSGAMGGADLGYLVPFDGSLDPSQAHRNISMQNIKSDVCPMITAKHVYFVFDACFAGLMLDTRAAQSDPRRDMAYLQALTREPVRQILTAGDKGQTVLDGGYKGHSVFTGLFIEALEGAQDYVTARELGQDLKKKVYGDAAARGHVQRPVDGEIYGTGDFVFVPDSEKAARDSKAQVDGLSAELARLERMKEEAARANDDAKVREMERQRLLKEAELKQAELRKKEQEDAAKRQELAAIDFSRSKELQEKQARDQEERLKYLKEQAERIRKEMGDDATGGATIEAAVAELKRIKAQKDKIEADFATELTRQTTELTRFYNDKLAKVLDIPPQDTRFETDSDYAARKGQADAQAAQIRAERDAKLAEIRRAIGGTRDAQVKPLEAQMKAIQEKRFVVSGSQLSFRFTDYKPQGQIMLGETTSGNQSTKFFCSMPKAKARDYFSHPELLVAELHQRPTVNGPFVEKAVFKGPEQGDTYAATCVSTNSVGMDFVYIQPGNFTMGSENGQSDERPPHDVTLSRGFLMQTTEVTQAQWKAVMGNNPSNFSGCDDCPVETVSWDDCQEFIKRLNGMEGTLAYRLPTEAEWEYACRAGSTTNYYFGDSEASLGDYAWYDGNSGSRTHQVAQKQPNAWGLYDMAGNVWEWCSDWYNSNYYAKSPNVDPVGLGLGASRVNRGGSWYDDAWNCRSADRGGDLPRLRFIHLGFRVVSSRIP